MKTTQSLSLALTIISTFCISSCGTFVEKDGKTALEISAIQPGLGQVGTIDVPTGSSGTDVVNPTGSTGENKGEGSGSSGTGSTDVTSGVGSNGTSGSGSGSSSSNGSEGSSSSNNGGSGQGGSSGSGNGGQSSSTPMDCSGQVVSFVRDTYDDFSVWMPFSGGYGQTSDQILFNSKSSGYYEFYVSPWGSGNSEQNESFYLQVINSQNSQGTPSQKNCDQLYVVKDEDNQLVPAADKKTYAGTFYVSQGENRLSMNHFCEYFSQNRNKATFMVSQCAALHEGYATSAWPSCKYSVPSTGCLSGTANGLTIDVSTVCVKPVNK